MKLSRVSLVAAATIVAGKTTDQEVTAEALASPAVDILNVLVASVGKAFGSSANSDDVVDKFVCPLTREVTGMVKESLDLVDNDKDWGIPDSLRKILQRFTGKSSAFQKLMDNTDGDCKMMDPFGKIVDRTKVTLENTSHPEDGSDTKKKGKMAIRHRIVEREVSVKDAGNAGSTISVLANGGAIVLRTLRDSCNNDYSKKHINDNDLDETFICPVSDVMAGVTAEVVESLAKKKDGINGRTKDYAQNLMDAGAQFINAASKQKINCRHNGVSNLQKALKSLGSAATVTASTAIETAAAVDHESSTQPDSSTTTASSSLTSSSLYSAAKTAAASTTQSNAAVSLQAPAGILAIIFALI